MNLTKKIELYFGKSPVVGDTPNMNSSLKKEKEFCAIYTQTDIPAEVHNKTYEHMLNKFGVHSQFAKDNKNYIRPYILDIETTLACVPFTKEGNLMDVNADNLRGTKYRAGGTFFNLNIAEPVLKEFEILGYQIEKMYK